MRDRQPQAENVLSHDSQHVSLDLCENEKRENNPTYPPYIWSSFDAFMLCIYTMSFYVQKT